MTVINEGDYMDQIISAFILRIIPTTVAFKTMNVIG